MTMTSPARRADTPIRAALVVLEGLLGCSALYGAFGLLTDTLGMSDAWLSGTPFASWTLPAVALVVVVVIPMLGAAALEARRHRLAPAVSVLAGAAQVGWIAVQLLVFQRYVVLQPVVLLMAAAILLLAGLRATVGGRSGAPDLPPASGRS